MSCAREIVGRPGQHLFGGRDCMNKNLFCLASSFRALLDSFFVFFLNLRVFSCCISFFPILIQANFFISRSQAEIFRLRYHAVILMTIL